ncbi:hypothetical protein niasHS_010856 [Heterodera schachtii]|uniref:Globin domain-containing protein n=1 Tax=Heterodera schachtii TaxID=97005 RepID=A0ABD2ISS8_HETSC
MGNANSAGQEMPKRMLAMKRNESFGSKSPRRVNRTAHIEQQQEQKGSIGEERTDEKGQGKAKNGTTKLARQQQHQMTRHNRSQSLEQSGMHSPSSSSRSSSSNSYINSVLGTNCAVGEMEKSCLRQSTEPMFNISGDLNPHQIGLVRRAWKTTLKATDNEGTEIAIRILLRIFQLDPRNLTLFSLRDSSAGELRMHPLFTELANTFEPTLVHLMGHLTNATTLSKHLQQLGGRHVSYTGVTYKCAYWKSFSQALVEVIMENGGKSVELRDALIALADFCVEQMKIGYRIEHKLQCEAERLAQAQKRRRAFAPRQKSPI